MGKKHADRRCPDCAVFPGEYHEPGCDVERCPICGGQLLSCDHSFDEAQAFHARQPWSGRWPGKAECDELGWFCYWDTEQQKYVRCGPDHPGAGADLNRLEIEGVWDPEQQKYVKKG